MRVEVAAKASGVSSRRGGTRRRGALVLLAGAAGLVLSQLVVPAARATGPVQAWEASANSAVLGVSPSMSGLFLTTTFGQAYAAYDQTETQATSAMINLGGLGYAVASSPLCGNSYSLKQQPQLLTADSNDGASDKTVQAQVAPGANTPAGTGTEHVAVSPDPESADARTYPVAQSVPGLIDVEGVAQSDVSYVDGQAQKASSSVTEDLSLLGGAVRMEGLKWTASQQRGASDPASAASFSYSSIVLSGAGVPVTIPSTVPFAAALKTVNDALAILGVSVSVPQQLVDPGTGGISMTALQVHFSGSALDDDLASPAVGPLTQLLDTVNGQVSHGTDCTNVKNLLGELSTVPETGLNLLMSGISGSGAVDMYFGGASADTIAAPAFTNPFDTGNPLGSGPLPSAGLPGVGDLTGGASAIPGSTGAPTAAALPAASTSSPTSQPAGRSTQSITPAGVVRCVTTNPAGGQGCWRGIGTWAAGAVVVLGGGLLAADVVYGRRRPRPGRRWRLTQ